MGEAVAPSLREKGWGEGDRAEVFSHDVRKAGAHSTFDGLVKNQGWPSGSFAQ